MSAPVRPLVVGLQRRKGHCARTGRRLLLSKGRNRWRNLYSATVRSGAILFVSALVVEYRKAPRALGLTALLCNALGCWFYFAATAAMGFLGYYRAINSTAADSLRQLWSCDWPATLAAFPPHSYVCLLATALRARFVRAPGSVALVLSTDFFTHWALLVLPSRRFKVLSPLLTVAHWGSVQPARGVGRGYRPKAGF